MTPNVDLLQEVDRENHYSKNAIPSSPSSTRKPVVPQSGVSYTEVGLEVVERILAVRPEVGPRLIVFAGVEHGNGCSHTAISVSKTLAKSDRGKVCLVEANFRSPGLVRLLAATNQRGLAESLNHDLPALSLVRPVVGEPFSLLSSGCLAQDSPNLLTSSRLGLRFTELRKEFDFVIVDAPPLTPYPDSIALGKLSDGLILIVEAESTRREAALAVVGCLRSSQIEILGAVLTKRTFPIPDRIYRRL
jgi:Mrp family chromosome partitioning ATPase